VQARSVLAYEIAQYEQGPTPTDPCMARAAQRSAEEWAALMLVSTEDFVGAWANCLDLPRWRRCAAWTCPRSAARIRAASDADQDMRRCRRSPQTRSRRPSRWHRSGSSRPASTRPRCGCPAARGRHAHRLPEARRRRLGARGGDTDRPRRVAGSADGPRLYDEWRDRWLAARVVEPETARRDRWGDPHAPGPAVERLAAARRHPHRGPGLGEADAGCRGRAARDPARLQPVRDHDERSRGRGHPPGDPLPADRPAGDAAEAARVVHPRAGRRHRRPAPDSARRRRAG
jgi:hypothetical protein